MFKTIKKMRKIVKNANYTWSSSAAISIQCTTKNNEPTHREKNVI